MERKNTPSDKTSQTLLEAVRYFSDVDVATAFVAKLRTISRVGTGLGTSMVAVVLKMSIFDSAGERFTLPKAY